jgi:hypothetical protein
MALILKLRKWRKYMNRRKKLFMFMLVVMIFINSCTNTQSRNAAISSVFLSDRCDPPCWYGITPGTTTREEAMEILKTIPIVDMDTIKSLYTIPTNERIGWDGRSEGMRYFGKLEFSSDIVKFIWLYFDKDITFDELITVLGKPEKALIFYVKGSERDTLSIDVLYPSRGIWFNDYYYTLDRKNPIQIAEDEKVQSVYYCDPEDLFVFFTSGPISDYPRDIIDKGLQDWKGFGDYQYLYVDLDQQYPDSESTKAP